MADLSDGSNLLGPVLMQRLVLVVAQDGDVWIYRTADRAAEWMEAQDVRNGEYRLFDCAGAQFELVAATDSSRVQVGHRIDGGDDFDLVRAVAIGYLKRIPPKRRPPANPGELRTPEEICRALEPFAG